MRDNLAVSAIAPQPSEFRRLLHACIVQNGKSLTELPAVWFGDHNAPERLVVECRGWDEIERLRREGRSIIFLTPHMGCFEIAARYFARRFPLTVMYRPQRAAWLNALMDSGRASGQLELAPTSFKGVRMLAKALRRGQSVGLLPDHAPGLGEGVWASFFGRAAYTMTLPRKLQRASGAAILMAFAERLPHGEGFRLHFERLSECEFNEEKMNRAIEGLVRRFPDQYHWHFNRYKRGSARQRPTLGGRQAEL
jgi:KDO2-lipid IV(A) lauroyltransferase